MKNTSLRDIVFSALVGALYVVLCYFGNIFGLNFGVIQFRFAEALTVLPFLCPATAWGLFVGCVLANLLSPYGLPDLIFGSLATLLAGLLTARCKSMWMAPLPPALCNGLIVGALLAWYEAGFTAAFPGVFLFNALSVGISELLVCCILGLPLLALLTQTGVFPKKGEKIREIP